MMSNIKNKINLLNEHVIFDKITYEKIIKKINDFCSKLETSKKYYDDKRKASRAEENIKIGKYGEIGTYMFLRKYNFPELKIDFEIRDGNKKGWVADLPYNSVNNKYPNIHVKTCDKISSDMVSEQKDIYTWTFQYSNSDDKNGNDILFREYGENDIVSLVYIKDMESNDVEIVAMAPWKEIIDILKDPILEKYKGIKKCLYYKDLLKKTYGRN